MFCFAMMESAINGAVKSAMSMGDLDAAIILANMDLSRKLYILRSANALRSTFSEKTADDNIKEAQEQLEVRNIVAHTVFGPTSDGKVKFLTVKAKRQLQYPDIEWSIDDFNTHFAKMYRLAEGFKKIGDKFTPDTSANILSSLIQQGVQAMRTVDENDGTAAS